MAAVIAMIAVTMTAGSAASAQQPPVTVSTSSATPGERVVVDVASFGSGVVTVALCGNEARRGSTDCDLDAAHGVVVREGQRAFAQLVVTVPPAPCPCVIRVSDRTNDEVVKVPFEVVGAPVAAPVDARGTTLTGPIVQAAIEDRPDRSVVERTRASLGGPIRRVLVLEVSNSSDLAIEEVTVVAALGRGGGRALDAPAAFALDPGASRRVEVDVEIEAISNGSYLVAGTVYGDGRSTTFEAATSTRPWGLVVLAVVIVFDLVAAGGLWQARRVRDRRPADIGVSITETGGELLLEPHSRATAQVYGPPR